MADIKFYCRSCGKKLGIDAAAVGMMIRCPGCRTELRVPNQSEDPPVPAVESPRAPLPVRPHTSAPAVAASPSPVAAPMSSELKKLQDTVAGVKSENEKLTESNNRLAEELKVLRSERDRLLEQQQNAQQLLQTIDDLQKKITAVEKEKVEWEKERQVRHDEVAALSEQVNALTNQVKQAESQAGELLRSRADDEAKIKQLENKAAQPALDRDKMAIELRELRVAVSAVKSENAKLVESKARLSEELKDLRAEHNALLQQQQDASRLSRSIEEMKGQIAELRDEEKKLVHVLSAKEASSGVVISPPPPPPVVTDRAGRMAPRRASGPSTPPWLTPVMGFMLLVMAAILAALLLWPQQPDVPSPEAVVTPEAQASPPGFGRNVLSLGESLVTDGLEVAVLGARIAPVEIVSVSGIVSTSAQHYLVVDIRVINHSSERDVYVFRTWRDARLTDDQARIIPQAFTDNIGIGEVSGVANGVDLPIGAETGDLIIFEWENQESDFFLLVADPVFWRRAGEESFAQVSRHAISVKIPRASIKGL